jgi:hypothetical protein
MISGDHCVVSTAAGHGIRIESIDVAIQGSVEG